MILTIAHCGVRGADEVPAGIAKCASVDGDRALVPDPRVRAQHAFRVPVHMAGPQQVGPGRLVGCLVLTLATETHGASLAQLPRNHLHAVLWGDLQFGGLFTFQVSPSELCRLEHPRPE